MIYDHNLNYFDCLKKILIERRNYSKSEIIERFPLFHKHFAEIVEIIFSHHINFKDISKTQQQTYDDGKTFAECVYKLLCESKSFDVIEKRKNSMPEWVAWYEDVMARYPIFYDNFKTLMRNICEGRIFGDPVTCMLIVSIEAQHRGVMTHAERNKIFNDFVTRKGMYAQSIANLQITEDEWKSAIKEYFDKRRDKTLQ